MNKADLNRKIQLLEEKNAELYKINEQLIYCECEECSKIRQKKKSEIFSKMEEITNLLTTYSKY